MNAASFAHNTATSPMPQSVASARTNPRATRCGRILRTCFRGAWLVGELALAFARNVVMTRGKSSGALAVGRAHWLQMSARRVLRVFGVQLSQRGDAPCAGLLVSNHLSYLDILVLASVSPAVFVAKADVARWPVLGRLARLAGTRFVRRESRADVARVNREIQAALNDGFLLVMFPEGTSSGGETVLAFKSSLFEPAIRLGTPVTAGCIRYGLTDGDPAEEVCYWRDMTLLPHLLNLLGRRSVQAAVAFAPVAGDHADRKALAIHAHATALALHRELATQTNRHS